MTDALQQHLERVTQAGILLIEDDGNIILVGCKGGVVHQISICPFRDEAVGKAVLSLLQDVRPH